MISGLPGYRRIAIVFWVLALVAIAIWSCVPGYVVGWDLQVYENAIRALHAGHDPYADGIAVQRIFHSQLASHPYDPTPFTYVYSPITLPILGLIGWFPLALSLPIYWLLYAAGAAAAIWAAMQAVEDEEMPVFALLAPAAVFFPGLLQNDVLFSGNVAYILYGLVLIAAVVGWRTNRWAWFYGAVLVASCGKAPMLSLLVIPVLSARRQWFAAGLTGIAGMALFAMQPMIWPAAFANYLEAVELQFSYNHDFGSSPAGLVADALYNAVPYKLTSGGFYLLYAIPCLCILLYLSRFYFDGRFSQKQWIPVVLVGALLMNPRIMEYDAAPMALPMALIVWRFFGRGNSRTVRIVLSCVFFALVNFFGRYPHWRVTESFVLVGAFTAGTWCLLRTQTEPATIRSPNDFEVEHTAQEVTA